VERHQKIAVLLACLVLAVMLRRGGFSEPVLAKAIILLSALALILLYRLIVQANDWGFSESLASDFGMPQHPLPYAVFFWTLFLIVCAFQVFDWSVY
jgi:hypothetical protein